MASTISAGTTSGTAIAIAGDTSGALVLRTNGTTTAVTISTAQDATFAGKVTSAGALTLASNGTTTAVTIDTSQNVGIGTTAVYGVNTLSVLSLGAGGCAFFKGSNAPSYDAVSIQGTGAGTNYMMAFRTGASGTGTQVGGITSTASATTFATSSDYRLKDNVTPMTGALATVAQLKPCNYKWIVDGSDGQGFIAHEIQAVVPDCVIGEKDAVDAEGKPKYQGIDTSFLVATLTAAIQEQQALITQLQTQITALNAKVGI